MTRKFLALVLLLVSFATARAQTWIATSDSTQGGIYVPSKAIDDDGDSFYHSAFDPVSPDHPHRLDVDTDQVSCVCGFDYRQRHDGYVNGNIREWQYWTCVDGGDCGTNGADWIQRASGEWDFSPGDITRTVKLPVCVDNVRFVRLRSLSSYQATPPVGDGRNMAAADFRPRKKNTTNPTPCRVLSLTTQATAGSPYALNLHNSCGSDIAGTVQLGDSADYTAATKVTQPKGSWVNGKATGTIDLGAFACTTPLWLFVTPVDGSPSAGFKVNACQAKGQTGTTRVIVGG